ncbi:hypothetical protein BOTBODRAFT_173913 [Botryobasidium botryosum FD-172 SS1]|uniref:Ribosomal protein L22 n=1 Tax=Botryobasidium botryosum (strain FD-172 SS1) TaxID=930990 RepID=A0A067MUA2_BOTB1|nr:hypothetical protein BOTBODRAFT_173913 [Botryobasidium botryosum FD-172 SS1]
MNATFLLRRLAQSRATLLSHTVAPSIQRVAFTSLQQRSISFGPTEWIKGKLRSSLRREDKASEVEAAKAERAERGQANLFDAIKPPAPLEGEPENTAEGKQKVVAAEHRYSTASFRISPRKLNMLARQVAGKPIDAAILQMVFSDKRASKRIKSMLVVARDHAEMYKNMPRDKLVISEAWVAKGKTLKRVDIKGRGRSGVRKRKHARMHVVLKQGKTHEELVAEARARTLRKVVAAGLVREDKPIQNYGPRWAW